MSLQELIKQNKFENTVQNIFIVNLHNFLQVEIIECLKYTSLVYIQYCLQNIEDNTNSKSDFLSNIDISIIFLYATMYSGIILNIILEVADI